MTNLPQKNLNSIQFGKEIVHVNHVLIPGPPILKENSLEDCSFSVDPKRTVKLHLNFGILRNFLGSFRKSSAIVGSSSETLALGRKKNLTPLAQKKLALYIKSPFFSANGENLVISNNYLSDKRREISYLITITTFENLATFWLASYGDVLWARYILLAPPSMVGKERKERLHGRLRSELI